MCFLCLFSIIVCCTNGANNPGCIIEKCGNLIDFKPSISYNDPATNGFVAGKYIDGSTIYAGQGDFNVCWWQVISLTHQKKKMNKTKNNPQNPAPARIQTSNSISGPGAYSSCGGALPAGENYDKISPKYFYNHPDLKWVPTTIDKYSTVPGKLCIL